MEAFIITFGNSGHTFARRFSQYRKFASQLVLQRMLRVCVCPVLAPSLPRSGIRILTTPSYSDSVAARVLSGSAYNSNTQTEEACASYCGTKGFKYAGVEYGVECCKSQSHLNPPYARQAIESQNIVLCAGQRGATVFRVLTKLV